MYRKLDRGTIYFKRQVIKTSLKGHEINPNRISKRRVKKIPFKSIYRLLNKVKTFLDYGEIPSLGSLSDFLPYLKKRKNNEIIFTATNKNMGHNRLFKTLDFVTNNISSLTTGVVAGSRQKSTRDSFKAIQKIPKVGDFFAWQIRTDLLECRVLGANTDNTDQWTCLGLGVKNGLRRVFQLDSTQGELGATRLLIDLSSVRGAELAWTQSSAARDMQKEVVGVLTVGGWRMT